MNEGTHIRAFLEHAPDAPEITRLVIHVYPLPPQIAADLSEVIREACDKFLTEQGLTNGTVTDVLNRGGEH